MNEDATASLVKWGVIGIGLYLVYEYLNPPAGSSPGVLQSVANGIVNLTSPAAPVPQGSVIMPNGTTFPASQLTNMQFGFDPGTNNATFLGSDGNTYQLSSQVNGNYTATLY